MKATPLFKQALVEVMYVCGPPQSGVIVFGLPRQRTVYVSLYEKGTSESVQCRTVSEVIILSGWG